MKQNVYGSDRMIKLTGCVLIFISSCLLGSMKAATYKSRTRELENILELIKLLELEISYRKEPLEKTFRKVASQKSCWFSTVLAGSAEALNRLQRLHEAWQEALENAWGKSPLDSRDMEILRDMALGLGRSDAEGQSRILEPAALRLKTRLDQAREQEAKQGRMYRGLGISAGVVIVIMII